MFNKDFYPTPPDVIAQMLFLAQNMSGAVVLEPSAGKGDIVDAVRLAGAKEVLVCEYDKQLAPICSEKADRFLRHDFMKVQAEDVVQITHIFMNPPFSADEKHILHAIEIAPPGCQILALCNHATYKNWQYNRIRQSLRTKVDELGTYTNLGSCFTDSERTTNVEVGLINIFLEPSEENEFDGVFDLSEEYDNSDNGILKYDEIRDLISRYVGAVKDFDSVQTISDKINSMIEPFKSNSIKFGAYESGHGGNYRKITRDIFKKQLQKSAWKTVFDKLNMEKYVTKSVIKDINLFVEKQERVPFTLNNIYRMVDIIVGTHASRMERIIIECFDDLTQHTFENRFQKEGWKTNSQYMVNQKFIINWGGIDFESGNKWSAKYDWEKMNDLNKAMCYITGTPFGHCENWLQWSRNMFYAYEVGEGKDMNIEYFETLEEAKEKLSGKVSSRYSYKDKYQYREFGKWHEWGFFTVKAFKKGTLHVKFNNEDDWIAFNRTASKAKGFHLAEKFTSDFRSKETGVRVAK